MNISGEKFIVSIKSDSNEVRFDGSMIDAGQSLSLTGLERVILLKVAHADPIGPQARIDRASAILSSVETDHLEEHHILSSEGELSKMVDDFMATHQAPGRSVSFEIPDSSIGYIPGIASKFGVVSNDKLPGQYL